MERRFHPVADIFPLLEGDEFDSLVESVKTKGLLNAIWLHPDGSIIDGRNRERACARAGVEPRYQTWDGKGSLTDFAFAQNFERRHLSATLKAIAAEKAEPFYAAEAKERQRLSPGRPKKGQEKVPYLKKGEEQARDKAAKAAKTNPHYVSDVKKIKKEAPELYAKMEVGKIELPKAKRLLVEAEAKKKLLAAGAIVRPAIETCDLRVCSMQELLGELRGLDAIITDPPYPEQYLPLFGELARLAATALKPGGVLAVMCGQSYLPQIMSDLSKHMPYRCSLAYMMPGQATQIFPRRVNCQWKPVLVFGGRKWITDDVVEADKDKRFHAWGQGEGGVGRIVDLLTEPDALVCDPFLGAGTTAVACVKLHRRIIGCDIDATAVETARARAALALAPFARKPIPAMLGPWINKIHRGDCVEVMGKMPEKSIDVIVTSPPYNIRNSTGGGMRNNGGGRWKNCGLLKGYDGLSDDMPHAEYVAWQRRCLTEMMRVLKDDGAVFYNHKPRVQGGLWQDRDEIVAGFPRRQEIIWERAGGINSNPGYFLPTYEVVYLICKPEFKLAEGANRMCDVWHTRRRLAARSSRRFRWSWRGAASSPRMRRLSSIPSWVRALLRSRPSCSVGTGSASSSRRRTATMRTSGSHGPVYEKTS